MEYTDHSHDIQGMTTYDLGHFHYYNGATDYVPNVINHTHYYNAYTTLDHGHKHVMNGATGPAIYLPDGMHYHVLYGVTSVDGQIPHTHSYTSESTL